ncbi:MAG: ankyrin repeat domain-containing protein [Holophagaceae bacterium]|uniref:Ankyrin repeat domain-containing protein n=1 Tax=Candidatus Geothrix skivensis TaxID=2954439 RepID=A0A9D7SF15_9BACT|nr:ankyrin repeat domain-containing protein [Candidatus Geothrix skivensis]
MKAPSPILEALYRHAFQEAEDLAEGADLSLWEAAALGRVADLERWVARGAGAGGPAADGFTALHLACYFGHPEAAASLLAQGADPAAPAPGGLQPLHSALASPALTSVPALVRMLLAAGAPVNAVQRGGFTAFHAAAQRGSIELSELLLGAGANPELRNGTGEGAEDLARGKGQSEWLAWWHGRA